MLGFHHGDRIMGGFRLIKCFHYGGAFFHDSLNLFDLIIIGGCCFVYARIAWGHFWSWDPKEVWATVTWLFYAALLHERLAVGWRGRRSAVMAIIGFAVILFTFLGVNLFMEGHHGEFTKW